MGVRASAMDGFAVPVHLAINGRRINRNKIGRQAVGEAEAADLLPPLAHDGEHGPGAVALTLTGRA